FSGLRLHYDQHWVCSLGKSQSNECARRIATTRRFVLLCSTHGDEMGARGQGHPETSRSRHTSQAHLASNWDSYFNFRWARDICRTRLSPGLQHLPNVFFLAAHVEALSTFEVAV